ncbi:unnamed protein product [Durusdinium trenchii]|uniref:Uncharacterized protein n=1 Tax=Durusdinium trenchii TaxID=1381693 RepID=A0ABP0K1S8_9DINO
MAHFAILLSLAVCATDALDLPDLPGFLENLGDAIVESAKDVYSGKFTWNYTWHDSTVQAPSQFLPLVDQIREMPEATRDERNHWFGSCFLVCFVVVAFCGTIIVTLAPMVKGHAPQSYIRVGSIQRGEAASEPEVISEPSQSLSKLCQTVLVVLSFGGTFLASLTACVWSLQTGRLSKTVGLDWEVYLLLFALVSFWLLVQAVFAVRMLKPGEKFKLSTFVVACLTSLTPFVSDYFDTLKDAIFGALCVQSQHLGIQILGWLCWVYLLAIHIFFVRRPTCFAELSSTYLSVLLASPASQEESGGGGCLQELLLLLYKQLTSTKREMLLIENVPQAVFSIAFLYFEGGSTFVTIVSLGVPIVQIVLTLLLTNPVRRCVATALGKKINEALIRGNYVMSWQIWCEAEFEENLDLLREALEEMGIVRDLLEIEDAKMLDNESMKQKLPWIRAIANQSTEDIKPVLEECSGAFSLDQHRGSDVKELQTKKESELNLGVMQIGDALAQALAEALKVNNTVERINLEQNNIGPAGAEALAEALKVNNSVRKIYLRSNNIGPAGAEVPSWAQPGAKAKRSGKDEERTWRDVRFALVTSRLALRWHGCPDSARRREQTCRWHQGQREEDQK